MNIRYATLFTFLYIHTAMALTLAPARSYSITHNNITHEVYVLDSHMGQLEDGTWVKLVCIKKGMIGMPNVTMPSYRGTYINKEGERCYVFVAQPEGTITYNDQELKVYRTDDSKGFLSDGTKIRIECLPAGAMAKILITPEYRGTYYIEDTSGDKNNTRQCHVYTAEKMPPLPQSQEMRDLQTRYRQPKPALSGLGNAGRGFRQY